MAIKTKVKPTFTFPLVLIRNNGWTELFYDFETLAVFVSTAKIKVSESHISFGRLYNQEAPIFHRYGTVYNEWIVRDDRGKTVYSEDIEEYAPWKRKHFSYYENQKNKVRHFEALGLPIPHTGKGRGWGSFYRVPKHLAAWREKYAFDADYRGEKIKTRNKEKLPPTAWDDIARASIYDRSWKRFRKTRWKPLRKILD